MKNSSDRSEIKGVRRPRTTPFIYASLISSQPPSSPITAFLKFRGSRPAPNPYPRLPSGPPKAAPVDSLRESSAGETFLEIDNEEDPGPKPTLGRFTSRNVSYSCFAFCFRDTVGGLLRFMAMMLGETW